MHIFKPFDKVLCPRCSSNPGIVLPNDDSEKFPLRITGVGTFTVEGKITTADVNPSIFPLSMLETLKVIYPNLEDKLLPEEAYRETYYFLLSMFEGVLSCASDLSVEDALENTYKIRRNNACDWIYIVAINPYTLKPCLSPEEYLMTK